MVELSFSDDGGHADVGFAGDTLNTAVYLRRALSKPADVAFVSAVGVDALSDRLIAFIESEGVSTQQITRIPDRLPGIYAISRDPAGERSFAYWREASAARLLFDTGSNLRGATSFERLAGFDVIYYSAITLAIMPIATRSGFLDWLADYRRSGGRVAFDSNYRVRLWESPDAARAFVARAWFAADIGLPTVDDEQALFGEHDEAETLARLRGYGIREGAMKRGAAGPVPISGPMPDGLRFPTARRVVDTTAAGDSFNGAFLARYLTGGTLAEAMQSGHDCALDVIAQRGAIIPRGAPTVPP
jgi:2-dehydro-3-deoxygluconokinase